MRGKLVLCSNASGVHATGFRWRFFKGSYQTFPRFATYPTYRRRRPKNPPHRSRLANPNHFRSHPPPLLDWRTLIFRDYSGQSQYAKLQKKFNLPQLPQLACQIWALGRKNQAPNTSVHPQIHRQLRALLRMPTVSVNSCRLKENHWSLIVKFLWFSN